MRAAFHLRKLRITPFWPLMMLVVIVLLAGLPAAQLHLRFESALLQSHEWWRMITAHWVHLGWQHTLLNALGLLLVWYLAPKGPWFYWWGFYVVSGFVISFVLLFQHEVNNYVGASGVLHGMLLLAAYYSPLLTPIRRALFIAIILIKSVWEQTPWYSDDDLSQVIGGYVVTDAHLWGVISAVVALCLIELRKRRRFKHKIT